MSHYHSSLTLAAVIEVQVSVSFTELLLETVNEPNYDKNKDAEGESGISSIADGAQAQSIAAELSHRHKGENGNCLNVKQKKS